MDRFFEDLYDRFKELHLGAIEAIENLPQVAYDWRPGEQANSIAVLVTHIGGSQRFWIGEGALGEPSGRDRPREFRVSGLSRETLVEQLETNLEFLYGAFGRLSREDLTATRISPRDAREITAGWAVLHALEHTALHIGHLQLTRQLWEQRNPEGKP